MNENEENKSGGKETLHSVSHSIRFFSPSLFSLSLSFLSFQEGDECHYEKRKKNGGL